MKNLMSGISKYRVLLSQKINQVLLGKLSGNVPATVINSVEEHLHDPVIEAHVEKIITISEPDIAAYPFPGTYPASFRRSKAFDKKNLYLLQGVLVSPFSGLVWINDSYFLVESSGSLYRMIGWDNVLHEPLLEQELLEEQSYVVSCPNNPYYHWVFESLVGVLVAIETVPSAKVMIPANCPAYCKDVLKLLFGEKAYAEQIIVAESVKRVPHFIAFQQEPDAGFVHPVAIAYLQLFRNKVLQSTPKPVQDAPYIYVSRSKTKNRRLANEEEVESALQDLGFTVIYCEELSVAQQIAVFSQASCIVAPHGAGLSNIVWAMKQVRLLEIFAYGHFNDCFARIALSLGFEYSYTHAVEHEGSSGMVKVEEVVAMTHDLLHGEPQEAGFIAQQHALK